MWKLAKTKEQKIAVIDQIVPISARDWNEAIVAFIGDEDKDVAEKAGQLLHRVPLNFIIRSITSELSPRSAKALLRYAARIAHASLIIRLIEARKVTDIAVLDVLKGDSEHFWGPLVAHRDFAKLMVKLKEQITEKLNFSLVLQHKFLELYDYLSNEEIDEYQRDIDRLKIAEMQEQAPVEDAVVFGDDDVIVIEDDDDVVEFEDEFAVVDTEEEAVSFDDLPDFLFDDSSFNTLASDKKDETRETIQTILKDMTVGAKVKLAMTGNREVRKILIKDPVKMVAKAVLDNGGITAKELALIAANPAMPVDIITKIANTKSLNKHYQVKLALVSNPKLPVKLGLRFLEMIRMSDLKKIAKRRGIPNIIRKRALKKIK